ncbi:MAG: alanine/glycine:cation symporter family protein [Eubacteriales bacterium]|nr:alanine/glycine:cation symporter family protein [Eubacteriales bacterium]
MGLIDFINKIDGVLGGILLVILLLGCGLFFTFVLRGVQFRYFFRAFKLMFGGFTKKDGDDEGSLSSFQALSTAVAAQVGTGNVGGVATAIAAGGPGAIFWMWITAILGMPTIFAEAVLAQKFRVRKDGNLVGGPAFYISEGVGKKNRGLGKFLAGFFAVAIILALGIAGNMVQANSISLAVNTSFGIPTWLIGVALAALAAAVFIGGVKRIGRFAEIVVPFMAVLYIIASIVLLIKFRSHLGTAFGEIFRGAFTPAAAAGGFAGAVVRQAIRFGVQRGLFSNEAGMGSTPHAHAVASVNHPAEQGLIAFCGVFIDTVLVCSATALAILVTDAYKVPGKESVAITQEAFSIGFGNAGAGFLAICLTFFAFTTIIGWYYFGESNVIYLFGQKGLTPYRIFVVLAVIFGSITKVEFVWALNALLNNLMVYPNVIALFILTPIVANIYKDYNKCLKAGKVHYDYEVK